MSLVRSNKLRQVGFLADRRRINVGVTRAKRHFAVICDTETVANDAFIASLLRHINLCGDYRSALEYMDDDWETMPLLQDSAAIGAPPPSEG